MNYKETFDFFLEKKSTVASVENFIDQFDDVYDVVGSREKELMTKCIQQMFKKYYYSTLLPEIDVSPASIINTLVEREFSKDSMIVPAIAVGVKSKMIEKISLSSVCYSCDFHPFVNDLEYYVVFACEKTHEIDEYGMIPEIEKTDLGNHILLNDRHYMNILSMLALEAGLVKRCEAGRKRIAKSTPEFLRFNDMEQGKKLEFVIDASIKLSAKMLAASIPELAEEFTEVNIRNLLKKPKDYERYMESIMMRCGLDPEKIDLMADQFESGNIDIFNEESIMENASLLMAFRMFFDMYFFTLFGFYLQLIQPLYVEPYDINAEADNLFDSLNDYKYARMKLFAIAEVYDLTSLGELFFAGKRKPKRLLSIPLQIDDEVMYDIVCANKDYVNNEDEDEDEDEEDEEDEDEEDEDDEDEDDDDCEDESDYGDEDMDDGYGKDYVEGTNTDFDAFMTGRGKRNEASAKIRSKAQKVETIVSNPELDGKVFSFKVKWYYNKRVWHQVELLGSNTLDDLHKFIGSCFELEADHLYSFFMSNKAWDSSTEYSHPRGGGSSAKKIRISGLVLEQKQKFLYLYDYGEEQRFEVELTEVKDREEGVRYPVETKRSKGE